MKHWVDAELRLCIDELEIEPGELPRDAAERIIRRSGVLGPEDEIRGLYVATSRL